MIPVAPTPDRPASFYLSPQKKIGIKVVPKGLGQSKVQSEDSVVKQCTEYLRKNGWITKTIYTGGIPTASGRYIPNPSKGIPDSINFHLASKRMVFIEYKKSHGGIISQEQKEWHDLLRACNIDVWVISSIECLKECLSSNELRVSA